MAFLISLWVGKERDKGRGFSAARSAVAPLAARHIGTTQVNICSYEQMFTCDLIDEGIVQFTLNQYNNQCLAVILNCGLGKERPTLDILD